MADGDRGEGVADEDRDAGAGGVGGDVVFELVWMQRVEEMVWRPAVTVLGVVLLVVGYGSRVAALAMVVVGGWATFESWLWAPHRVTLGETAMVMEARARTIRIPWAHLESVGPAFGKRNRHWLAWRRAYGTPVRTSSGFVDLDRMLGEVKRRAPHASVSW